MTASRISAREQRVCSVASAVTARIGREGCGFGTSALVPDAALRMASTNLRLSTADLSAGSAWDNSERQSIASRSISAAVTSASRRGESGVAHLGGKAAERPVKRHARGIGGTPSHASELLVRVVELDVSDDQFTVGRLQTRQRRSVSCFVFFADGSRKW